MNLSDRVATFHEGPNRLALPFHGDAPFELLWADEQDFEDFPELEDVEDELSEYLLLAAARRSDVLRPILLSKAEPHPVFVFFEGFQQVAESLEAFAGKLASSGQLSPAQVLRAALDDAARAIDAGEFSNAAHRLERVLNPYGAPPADERDPMSQELARGFTDLGFAWHKLGDEAKAAHAYELGAAHGSLSAGKNLLTMHRDAGEWPRAKARAEALLKRFQTPDDLTTIRSTYAIALATLGDAPALEKLAAEHADYLKWLANDELERAKTLRDQFVATLKDAKADAGAGALLEPMLAALAQLALVGKSKLASDRDIERALDAIEKKQELKFSNWVKSKPAIAKDPRIVEAVGRLSEPAASKFRDILSRT